MFFEEELLALRPTPKLEDQPLLAIRECLFNIFAVTVHTGGRSSTRNLKTRHAAVMGTQLLRRILHTIMETMAQFNTLRTGDADLRFYITTVQDG